MLAIRLCLFCRPWFPEHAGVFKEGCRLSGVCGNCRLRIRTEGGCHSTVQRICSRLQKKVQERINEIGYDNVTSLVIGNKSQYRLFYPKTTGVEASSKGLLAVIKTNPNTGQLGFEYADIKGLKVSSCDSDYISNVETIVHGGYDGYIYLQESGNVFTTASSTRAIDATYRSPDMTMGDAGIRKSMDRVCF